MIRVPMKKAPRSQGSVDLLSQEGTLLSTGMGGAIVGAPAAAKFNTESLTVRPPAFAETCTLAEGATSAGSVAVMNSWERNAAALVWKTSSRSVAPALMVVPFVLAARLVREGGIGT